jgi:NADP-reducing hydrogenase subunit HndC
MTAPNPVLSTLQHFRKEYEAHVLDRRCPAGVCRHLLHFSIDEEKCTGCSLCARDCPVDVIFKRDDARKYYIEPEGCIHCGACFDVCRFDAVIKE